MVSIPACHAGDRGSIPRRGDAIFAFFSYCQGPNDRFCYWIQQKTLKRITMSLWKIYFLFHYHSCCQSIVGSVVECSPATRAARVRFPDDAVWFCFDIFPHFLAPKDLFILSSAQQKECWMNVQEFAVWWLKKVIFFHRLSQWSTTAAILKTVIQDNHDKITLFRNDVNDDDKLTMFTVVYMAVW